MKTYQIIEAAKRVAKARKWREVANRLEDIQSAPHYCEDGYSTAKEVILFGNWNDPVGGIWDEARRSYVKSDEDAPKSRFFAGVVKALEECAELEWSGEWTTCIECGGAIRTQADSYGWQRGYVDTDDGPVCAECAAKQAGSILESFEGSSDKCVTSALGLRPDQHGYKRIEQEFENGFYGGQDSDPEKIAATLRKRGIERFIFVLDAVGRFDVKFSAWVHESEFGLLTEELTHAETACELDPAEGLKRALQSAPIPTGEGITFVKCDPSTGTATARKVGAQEFIDGIKEDGQ